MEIATVAGIAALKAHLVKSSYSKRFQPSKHGIVADITESAIYSTRGRFCCYYSDYGEYTLSPSPRFFNALLTSYTLAGHVSFLYTQFDDWHCSA